MNNKKILGINRAYIESFLWLVCGIIILTSDLGLKNSIAFFVFLIVVAWLTVNIIMLFQGIIYYLKTKTWDYLTRNNWIINSISIPALILWYILFKNMVID